MALRDVTAAWTTYPRSLCEGGPGNECVIYQVLRFVEFSLLSLLWYLGYVKTPNSNVASVLIQYCIKTVLQINDTCFFCTDTLRETYVDHNPPLEKQFLCQYWDPYMVVSWSGTQRTYR